MEEIESEYIFHLGDGIVIDTREVGNLTRFINGTKENPNCEMIKRNINGFRSLWIVSWREIVKGEFLSLDHHSEPSELMLHISEKGQNGLDSSMNTEQVDSRRGAADSLLQLHRGTNDDNNTTTTPLVAAGVEEAGDKKKLERKPLSEIRHPQFELKGATADESFG